jgi:hypothetical protein
MERQSSGNFECVKVYWSHQRRFNFKIEGQVENKEEKEKKNEETDDKAKFILMSTKAENILR